MRTITAGLVGAICAGIGVSAVLLTDRNRDRDDDPTQETAANDSGTWHQNGKDALSNPANTDENTERMMHEQAAQLAATAGFGVIYLLLSRRFKALPHLGMDGLYGAGLYAARIADTGQSDQAMLRGEGPASSAALGVNLTFGVLTALAFAWLSGTGREQPGAKF